jgi:predicted RecA/RadA family phage recombinase
MATNRIQKGDSLTVPAPYDVASGAGAQVGGIFGVAQNAALSGADVVLAREDVWELKKNSAEAWGVGDRIYWDNTNKQATSSPGAKPGANMFIGWATEVAANPTSTGKVLLSEGGTGLRQVAGQHTTVTAADTIVTGLTTVLGVVATLDSDPGDDPEWVSATIGDQAGAPAAGSIIVKTWKNTGGTDPTPAAATTFSKKVNWLAWGY